MERAKLHIANNVHSLARAIELHEAYVLYYQGRIDEGSLSIYVLRNVSRRSGLLWRGNAVEISTTSQKRTELERER